MAHEYTSEANELLKRLLASVLKAPSVQVMRVEDGRIDIVCRDGSHLQFSEPLVTERRYLFQCGHVRPAKMKKLCRECNPAARQQER